VFYIPKDDILHSHRRENLKSKMISRYSHVPEVGYVNNTDLESDWLLELLASDYSPHRLQ
jgi:hypothetical protein